MKLKYYFLLVILALFTSCSNELGMQDNLNDSKILLSSDEYISIAYDNPGTVSYTHLTLPTTLGCGWGGAAGE